MDAAAFVRDFDAVLRYPAADFEEVNGDMVVQVQGGVPVSGKVVGKRKMSKKLGFITLEACDGNEVLQVKLDAAWLRERKVNALLKELQIGDHVLAAGLPALARCKNPEAFTRPARLLLALELDVVVPSKEKELAEPECLTLEPECTNMLGQMLKPSQMRGKKHADEMHVRQLLPPDLPDAPEFPSSWWTASLVVVGLGRADPCPMHDFLSDEALCNIQCTAAQATELGIMEECSACSGRLDEFCYPLPELLHPTSRFLKRACRDIGAAVAKADSGGEGSEGLALVLEARDGLLLDEDLITRCCICRAQWRARRPPESLSKRDIYLSAMRRIRSKLGRRTALLALTVAAGQGDRSGSVVAYVVTEAVPGKTVIAVDGCCCDPEIRGADAYLLHAAARWWKPFGAVWMNDGPAANEGIRAHKNQHHGVTVVQQVRYRAV